MDYQDTTKRYPSYFNAIETNGLTLTVATPDKTPGWVLREADLLMKKEFGNPASERTITESLVTISISLTKNDKLLAYVTVSLLTPRAKGFGFDEEQRHSVIEINSLMVIEEERRKGYATLLLKEAVEASFVIKGLAKKAITDKMKMKVSGPGGFNKKKISKGLNNNLIVRASFEIPRLAEIFQEISKGLGGKQSALTSFHQRDYTQIIIEKGDKPESVVSSYRPGEGYCEETILVYDEVIAIPDGHSSLDDIENEFGAYKSIIYRPSILLEETGATYCANTRMLAFVMPRRLRPNS